MFGYIKPYKPEMKMKEFDTFKAIYCGLCKQLSHVYGPFASLTLSYDFTFVAAVSLGLRDNPCGFQSCRCAANPLKKKACTVACGDLHFCASAAMLMIYYKVKDDLADSGVFQKIARLCILPFVSHARKKAMAAYPEIDAIISSAMQKQAEVERDGTAGIDRAADPTALALGRICEYLSDDPVQKKVLNRFGYLLGRYVYFADALDDLPQDKKSGGYNPFLVKCKEEKMSDEEIQEYAKSVINLTVGEIAPAYELLDLKRYKSILDNIIYLGLHDEIRTICNKCGEKEKKEQVNEQSL